MCTSGGQFVRAVLPDRYKDLAEVGRIVSPQLYAGHADAAKRHLGDLFVLVLMYCTLSAIFNCLISCA